MKQYDQYLQLSMQVLAAFAQAKEYTKVQQIDEASCCGCDLEQMYHSGEPSILHLPWPHL